MTWSGPIPKPSRTERKKARKAKRAAEVKHELASKAAVRRRDKQQCRFPWCGCRSLGLQTHVSHEVHKGMGGNPLGDRSETGGLVLLCSHRHQDGSISRGRGTMRAAYLTPDGFDGPVAWEIQIGGVWWEVAREASIGRLEPLTTEQEAALRKLARMEL